WRVPCLPVRRMLALLDHLLTVSHLLLIAFALTGWALRRLRRVHLAVMLAIAFSWLVLGARYGWGYCFVTDWAWQIKHARGETGLPASFVEYALERATGSDWNSALVDRVTGMAGALALILSLAANWKTRPFRSTLRR
ncbi:MAG TPA: DUF2784 domain-containing protein, partial [Bdellovibrionota bacterium]|nr:DUF2784 domain-containing protein [Bdellovibrionota bacterium]